MVPSQSILYIETSGGVQTTSTLATGFSTVAVALFIDNNFVGFPAYRSITAANTTGVTSNMRANWSFAWPVGPLAPGTHTIIVGASLESGSTANVSGGSGDSREGILNVIVVKG